MKKIALFLVASSFALAVNAQDGKSKAPAATPAPTTAATPAVTATRVATPSADQLRAVDANTKAHVCTDVCKDGKHNFVHGEKGHVCTSACAPSAKQAPKAAEKK